MNTIVEEIRTTVESSNSEHSNLEIEIAPLSNYCLFIPHSYYLESAAWGGSILVLMAYIGEFPKLTEFLMNTIGSSAIFCICVRKKAYQPMVLNAIWAIGSFYKYFANISDATTQR